MATTIKRLGRRTQYPWKLWTDGKARRAFKGKDFKCSCRGFAATLYSRAERKGLEVTVSIGPKAVDFRFSSSFQS